MISFFIPGKPIPQARPRTFQPNGSKKFVTTDPPLSKSWKNIVRILSAQYLPKDPIDEPVRVRLDFYTEKPKSKKDVVWQTSRPDLDNYIKSVLDALQTAGFFTDDARVVWLESKKLYSTNGKPGVKVTIMKLDQGKPEAV